MKASNTVRSNCEKEFEIGAIRSEIRLDGRSFSDYRRLQISFGESYGHCEVCLGDTKVLSQVTCEVVTPAQNRPTEGQVFFNLELSAMASPAFESGRLSDNLVEMNRFIERCLKASRPIDTESLCIVAGEKVWCIRVDIQVLDDAGNILDCACIAAITALAHFRLPDVTVTGKDVNIHSMEEREPIPLNVHHMPISVTFGFINSCEKPIVDPNALEEVILDGRMIIAMNSHAEICCMKMSGVSVKSHQIMMCCKLANAKVYKINEILKKCLHDDRARRHRSDNEDSRKPIGNDFEKLMITKTVAAPTKIDVTEAIREAKESVKDIRSDSSKSSSINLKNRNTGIIGEGGSSTWVISDEDSDKTDNDSHISTMPHQKRKSPKKIDYIALSDDINSEEEETVQVTSEDLGFQKTKTIKIDVENEDKVNKPTVSIVNETKPKKENINSLDKSKNSAKESANTSEINRKRNKKKKRQKTNL